MNKNNEFEVRSIEIRADLESRTIKGTAIVFNSLSENLGGFVEEIKPEACSIEFLNEMDIALLYNHEEDAGILARSKKGTGTLRYFVDKFGVHFEFEPRNTSLGNEVFEAVKVGDLDSCSFAFRIAEGGEQWENMGNGLYKRTITKFQMIKDFSIVITPAYSETSTEVKYRGLDELKEQELQEFKEQERINEEKRLQELNDYYSNFEQLLTEIKQNNN
jgi:phage prohead protease, HK97 family